MGTFHKGTSGDVLWGWMRHGDTWGRAMGTWGHSIGDTWGLVMGVGCAVGSDVLWGHLGTFHKGTFGIMA